MGRTLHDNTFHIHLFLLFSFRTEISQSKPSAAILVIEDLQPGTQYSCQGGMLVKVAHNHDHN